MNITGTEAGVLAAVGGFALVIFGKVFQFGKHLGTLDEKVDRLTDEVDKLRADKDAIWKALTQRGRVEGITKGLLVVNSPDVIVPEALEWFKPLETALQAFYREYGTRGLTDEQLMLEIQKRFGETIVDIICVPRRLDQLFCLRIALHVAKQAAIGEGGLDRADKA